MSLKIVSLTSYMTKKKKNSYHVNYFHTTLFKYFVFYFYPFL